MKCKNGDEAIFIYKAMVHHNGRVQEMIIKSEVPVYQDVNGWDPSGVEFLKQKVVNYFAATRAPNPDICIIVRLEYSGYEGYRDGKPFDLNMENC